MEKAAVLQFNRFLEERNLRIAFAESMTAGLLSATVASVPGASSVLKGGLVCYDPALKTKLLKVSKITLERFGAESHETTREMAEGLSVLETGAEILVAITGTASAPVNSYSTSAPAGSVFVCIGFKKRFHSFEAKFAGSRQQVLEKAVEFVLETVQELVKGG